jgi:hypothetical protein
MSRLDCQQVGVHAVVVLPNDVGAVLANKVACLSKTIGQHSTLDEPVL